MRASEHSTVRAIRGPVTLITVGVLFTLQNFTRYTFDQTWPVILIVFGLLSLVGRGVEPRQPAAAPPVPWPQPGAYPPAANPVHANYPPPASPAASSYRQSQYQQPVPPAAANRGGENEPGPNPASGPVGGSV